MIGEYEVHLFEDNYLEGEKEEYNPLHLFGCFGFQMCNTSKIDQQLLFEGTRIFTVQFHGEINHEGGEPWALPLRIDVLSQVRYKDWNWYLSFFGSVPMHGNPTKYLSIEEDFISEFSNEKNFAFTMVKTSEFYDKELKRIFFEVPARSLGDIITRYWIKSTEGWPIQGLLMPPGHIERIRTWSEQKQDVQLLREIVDETFVAFYTFPVENRHFCFYTNKLDLAGISTLINPQDLQRRATEIGKQSRQKP